MDLSFGVAELIEFLFEETHLGEDPKSFLRRRLVDLGEREANVNDRVIAHLKVGYIGEADLLADPGEVDPAHASSAAVVDGVDAPRNG